MNYMWLSFADEKTGTNLGVCIVEANDFDEGLKKSWKYSINPGGHVAGYSLNEEQFQKQKVELNRLYTRQEMTDLGH